MPRALTRAGTLALAAVLTACGATDPADPAPASAGREDLPTVRIASLTGPTTMGLVGLMDDAESTGAYQVTVHGTPDEVVPMLVQGEVDIALIPANLAAVLYQRTVDSDAQIAVLAINTLGVLSVVETGDSIETIADLRGRTVYSPGKGTTPEHVLNHLLDAHGLTPGTDVDVVFVSEATEVAAVLASDSDAVGVLPQPYVTVLQGREPDVRVALDLTDEWDAVSTDSQLVTGVVVARGDYVAEHPDAVEAFLADYRDSTEFTNDHPAEAAPLIVAAGLAPTDAVAEAAIPPSHITYIDGPDMRRALSGYLTVLFNADPASVGGSLPGDDFYHGD